MSSEETDKGPMHGPVRNFTTQLGSYAGNAGRWADAHVPGGQKVLWIILGLILLVLLIWAIRPASDTAQSRFGEGGPMPVGVAKAVSGDIDITLNALGTVTPLATVTVRPQVSGDIQSINFQEGQMVKAGDVLAVIDPRPYIAALDLAKGTLAKDVAALKNAKVDLARYQALWAQKAVSQQILATQAATVGQDEGVVTSDKANVESAQINLGYTKITSPVAGRVGLRQVDVGNLVQAGQTNEIVVVTELQPISVLFTVPEDYIDQIMDRVNTGAKLQVQAFDRSQSKLLSTGTLATVDNEIDVTTGTVKLRAMFDNPDMSLFPNQFVNTKLLINTLHNQIVVPTAAIQRGAQGSYLWVVGADKTVSMRTVTDGPTDGTKTSITKGLAAGETVVVDGADRLRDGSEISIPALGKAGMPPPASKSQRLQRMLSHLPASERAQVEKMTPEQRRAWFHAHHGQFHHGGGSHDGGL
ncbi:MAG: MdtA/MuxA family multidrug efflux RND transporter periplasmic adaptor subunit [Rhizomicrobium sp.]